MEQASSDAAAVLFFLRKEKEKNGGAKTRAGNARPYGIYFGAVENREPTIPPSRLRRATSLYTREASAAVGQKKGGPIGAAFQNRVIWLFSGRSPKAPAALRSSMWDFETFGQAIENSSIERNVLPSRPSMMSHAALSPRPETATNGGRSLPSSMTNFVACDL